jgi:hypothetical protein
MINVREQQLQEGFKSVQFLGTILNGLCLWEAYAQRNDGSFTVFIEVVLLVDLT